MYRELLKVGTKDAAALNNLAWLLSTCTDASVRDPERAVELAKNAVEVEPNNGMYWNTLGVAHYRAGNWKTAIEALTKSMELLAGQSKSFNTFFLAMAHWQVGDKPQARPGSTKRSLGWRKTSSTMRNSSAFAPRPRHCWE